MNKTIDEHHKTLEATKDLSHKQGFITIFLIFGIFVFSTWLILVNGISEFLIDLSCKFCKNRFHFIFHHNFIVVSSIDPEISTDYQPP